jgi:peptide alpha-N-acetyltransferase
MGRCTEAELEYLELIDLNSDNVAYLDALEKSKFHGMSDDERRESLFELYSDLNEKYPRSHAIHRKPLMFSEGEQFTALLEPYLIKQLRKGVPSLFNSVKDLLKDSIKSTLILQSINGFYNNLQTNGTFFGEEQDEKEPPTAFLWTVFFIAHYYDYFSQTEKALEFVNIAIGHSPTAVELYMIKARIYKHAGDHISAMAQMEEARSIDLQDRFVNSKCTKYMLRNDKIELAEKTISLFAKPNADEANAASANQDLIDMQCIWYAYGVAKARGRKKEFGLALQRYNQIYKHFEEFVEDQLDFHSYAVRKQTLRSYVDLVHHFQVINRHPFFYNAAKSAIETHLVLFEGGETAEAMQDGISLLSLKVEAREEALVSFKQSQEQQQKLKKKMEKVQQGKDDAKPVDLDRYGLKFVQVDHLKEATKFLKPLLKLRELELPVLELACRVYLAKSINN